MMKLSLQILALSAVLLYSLNVSAATLDDWRTRTIYQVLTDRFAKADGSTEGSCDVVNGFYCGGSWKGIVDKLDYIQGMHFDALWISPVVAQLQNTTSDGESYTAYWAQDLYSLNSNFGTADELRELIDEVHRRGMYLMLDIVVNHMAFAGPSEKVDYSVLKPFDDEKYYHSYCAVNGNTNETNVEACWLGSNVVSLPDLRTEDDVVRDMLTDWIREMVSNYSIDGLRIDTALNVEPEFFPDFVEASGVFATGETMHGDNSFVCRWADTIGSILNYPIYYVLVRAFGSPTGNINDLVSTIYTTRANCEDPSAFGIFSENHDVERFAEITNDTALAKNVLTFTLMSDGIPIIYQGQEQHMPGANSPHINRAPLWSTGYDTEAALYRHIATLVLARQHFIRVCDKYATRESHVIYQDYHTIAMRKGHGRAQVITVLNNNGESTEDFEIDVKDHKLKHFTEVTEILTCTQLTVGKSGYLKVPMGKGLPKVLFPTKLLAHSGLCGMGHPLPLPSPTLIATTYATTFATTIGGYSTMIATSVTTTAPSTPKRTKLALGAASHSHTTNDAWLVLIVAMSTFLASSGAFLYLFGL